jgi:membrane protein YdbS with pleckstrin-like domain
MRRGEGEELQLMPDQHVDPAAIVTWRLEAIVIAIVLGLTCAVPLAPVSVSVSLSILLAVIVAGAALGWYWPKARYRRLTYRLDEIGLTIQDGVWWRTQTSLPRVRIQHSDVSQGPLQRRYGIATLKLYTAGSRFTKVELEGLRHEDALALRDDLLGRGLISA